MICSVDSMKVIAIAGNKGSGKDTLYRLLRGQSSRFTRFAFADGIKMDSKILPGVEECLALHGKEAVRPLYQAIGTVAKLGLGEDYWIRETMDRIENTKHLGMIPVITDCRFPHEARMLREAYDCQVIRILRDTGMIDDHESETQIDKIESDIAVDNNGSIDALEKIAKVIAHGYLKE